MKKLNNWIGKIRKKLYYDKIKLLFKRTVKERIG